MRYDVIIVGGGPAGLAAACAASEAGAGRILIVERDRELGGILNQCIHNGFGLHYFKEELTGPEYAERFIDMLQKTDVDVRLDTMVLAIEPDHTVHTMSAEHGYLIDDGRTIILAMGCRERPRGAIGIPGDRPAGVLTAGTAQRFINMEGYAVGRQVVILGSGDIGLIMARRLSLEGAAVRACIELMPYSSGLTRNIVQCLDDFGIPLYLSHTITDIEGDGRVRRVIMAEVDANRQPIEATKTPIDCDTVLLSVGLVPENELTRAAGIEMDPRTNGPVVYENMETSIPGIFACGNVVHVHDLVDYVTKESERAGKNAALWRQNPNGPILALQNGPGVTYTVPQKIRRRDQNVEVFFRVNAVSEDKAICVREEDGRQVARYTRRHLTPGEMERILLPAKILRSVTGSQLSVSVEE